MKKYMWYRIAATMVFLFPVIVPFFTDSSFLIIRSAVIGLIIGLWILRKSFKAKIEYLDGVKHGNTTIDN